MLINIYFTVIYTLIVNLNYLVKILSRKRKLTF